jgi:hypothetical protein
MILCTAKRSARGDGDGDAARVEERPFSKKSVLTGSGDAAARQSVADSASVRYVAV